MSVGALYKVSWSETFHVSIPFSYPDGPLLQHLMNQPRIQFPPIKLQVVVTIVGNSRPYYEKQEVDRDKTHNGT